jgi:hypothetical protein
MTLSRHRPCPAQVYHDPSEPIVDPETGKLLTSRPTAFGKYLNTKVGRVTSMRTLNRVACACAVCAWMHTPGRPRTRVITVQGHIAST